MYMYTLKYLAHQFSLEGLEGLVNSDFSRIVFLSLWTLRRTQGNLNSAHPQALVARICCLCQTRVRIRANVLYTLDTFLQLKHTLL